MSSPSPGQLDITIEGAELVRIFDSFRPSQDLFVQLVCGYDDGSEKNVGRTEVCKNASHKPVWNERFLCGRGQGRTLKFKVFVDHMWRSATLCGEAEFDLDNLWSRATSKKQKIPIPLYKKGEQTGVMSVTIRLQAQDGSGPSGRESLPGREAIREAPAPAAASAVAVRQQPSQQGAAPLPPQQAPSSSSHRSKPLAEPPTLPQDERRPVDAGSRAPAGQPAGVPYPYGQAAPAMPFEDRRPPQPGHYQYQAGGDPQFRGKPAAAEAAGAGRQYPAPAAAGGGRPPQPGAAGYDYRGSPAQQQQPYAQAADRPRDMAPGYAPAQAAGYGGARAPAPQVQQQHAQRAADKRSPQPAAPGARAPPTAAPPTAAPTAAAQAPPGPPQAAGGQSGQWWESFINRG